MKDTEATLYDIEHWFLIQGLACLEQGKLLDDNSKKFVLFCFFSGHGKLGKDGNQCIILPNKPTDCALERKLSEFSNRENSYVIGIFDACRTPDNATYKSEPPGV